jgi:glycosyltransferase involved in cell wall biosynthesis
MPLRVCVVALNAYPAIDPRAPGGIGGIETRSWLFARGLARQPETEVTFVVRHWQPLLREEYEGVRVRLIRDRLYPMRESLTLRLQRSPQFPWVKLKEPKLSDALYLPLLAARKALVRRPDPLQPSPFYQQIDADVFLTFGVQSNSAAVIASAHANKKPAVLFLGSDSDLDERYLSDSGFVSTYRDSAAACLWTIRQADRILCQTQRQQDLLASRFERTAVIVRNPIDLEDWDAGLQRPVSPEIAGGLARYILWVGRAEGEHKRPMTLIDVARRCPELNFLMILNRRDDVVEAEVRRAAPANVRIVERIPFRDMPGVMRQAAALANTSALEGFPNTYLQAAASAVPVVSLNVEPEFLAESRAGWCMGGDLEMFAERLRNCWRDGPSAEDRACARRYVDDRYSLARQSEQLRGLLQEAVP